MFFFFKQKTAYEIPKRDWSSDVCSSDLLELIVTSSAYRQSADATKEKLEKDPANRFISRGPRFRMDAEMIRDSALAASGLLVEKIGGAPVKPYQPDGIWEVVGMPESNRSEEHTSELQS